MTEAAPRVSVVIATYNMAQYLGDAIRSVLQQSMADLDLHVIDDGSTDDTAAVVGRIADPRIRYHRQANSGQTRAKNVGIARSRGDLVAFCDADDLWVPKKLERQLPLFDSEEVGVVYSRNQHITLDGKPAGTGSNDGATFGSGWVTEELFQNNFISFGTALVRRRCLEEFGAFDESFRMGIDWDLWLRISTRYQIRFLDDVTYLYRVWPGQMSNNWRGRYEHVFRIMEKFVTAYPDRISPRTYAAACAHSYTERARLRTLIDSDYTNSFRDVLTALRYRPLYMPAWKTVGRVVLTAIDRLKREPGRRS